MPNQIFSGFVYTAGGAAVNGATVDLFDRNTTTPNRGTTTTNASGFWTLSTATQGRYDVRITNGTSISFLKYDDEFQIERIETANLLIRNPADTFKYDIVPAAITADRQLNLPLITATDTLMSLGVVQTITGRKDFDAIPVRFITGVAVTAAQYEVVRDADATNQLHLNVPTGATLEFSINDVAQMVLGSSALTGNVVGTGASQVAQGSHTHAASGVDISVRAVRTAAQSITNNTDTAIAFNGTDTFDTDTMHDPVTNNTRITFNTAGKFILITRPLWAGNATGARVMFFRLNGVTDIGRVGEPANATPTIQRPLVLLYTFAATDYVEVMVNQDSGAALDLNSAQVEAIKVLG